MLQRSQSLYLLLGAALLAVFVALGDVWSAGVGATMPWLGPVAYGLAVGTAVAALVAVALYKDRARQRRLIGVAQWIDLVLVVAVLVGLFAGMPDSSAAPAGALPTGAIPEADALGLYGRYLVALAPLVVYVLLRMARRGVDRDIATVRSMDRIR